MAIATRILVLCLVLLVGSTEGHALYGQVDTDNQFPFVVRVSIKKGNGYKYCTATMRTKRMAITAAHCVYDEDTGRLHNNIILRFTDEKGAVRQVAAKPFVSPDYPEIAKKIWPMKRQFDRAKAKKDGAWLKEIALQFLDLVFIHTSRDLALLLPVSDVNVSAFLPATILDDDLPFATLLQGFEQPQHRWTPETYALAGAVYRDKFIPRMTVAKRPDDRAERGEMFQAHAVGYGLTCRTEKDTRCKLFDGKRRYSPILVEYSWYYLGLIRKDPGFLLSIFTQDPKKQEVTLAGDSGGPILIRDKVTDRLTQIGVITSSNYTKLGSFWTSASCLLQHAGLWKEFLGSSEYRNAMLTSGKPRKGR